MTGIPMPWRLLVACAALGGIGGALLGFARGLNYLPTLPFALVEGAILIGIPSTALGLVLAGVWSLSATVRRRAR